MGASPRQAYDGRRPASRRRYAARVGIISWIVWGLVVGAVARLLTPCTRKMGILLTMGLGIVGSLVGGWIATGLLGIGDSDNFDFGSFLIAVLGSILLLVLYQTFAKSQRKAA